MKAKDLSKIMQTASRLANGKNTLPILSNVLIENGQLKATNLELWLSHEVDENITNKPVLIPGKELKNIVSKLPKESEVAFEQDGEVNRILIDGKKKFKFPAVPVDDFPVWIEVDQNSQAIGEKDYKNFLEAFKYTANDELRPVMECVCLSDHIVASDAHKLVFKKADFVLPEILVNSDILPFLDKKASVVNMFYNEKGVSFDYESYSIARRIEEGNYPKWNSVVPDYENAPIVTEVDRKELITEINQALITANQASKLVRFWFRKGVCQIRSQDLYFDVSFDSTINTDHTGDEIEIGFKGSFLLEILNAIEEEKVELRMVDTSKATVINGEYLLMPMMINS